MTTNDYSYLCGRRFNELEFEEQAWVRQLVRQGLVRFVSRPTGSGVMQTWVELPC